MPEQIPTKVTPNPLDDTLFPPLIKAIGEFWNTTLTVEVKNNLVLGMNLFVIAFVMYILWLILDRLLELRETRYYLKVTFDQDLNNNDSYDSQILGLISGLHTLAKSKVVTFEIHKSKDFTGFLFSSSDQSVLNNIKTELSRINNLRAEILTSQYEPLTYQFVQYKQKVTTRPYQLQMVASQEYGNFRKDQLNLTRNLIGIMQSIPKDQFGIVIFAFRPVIKEYKIKGKIAKLEYKIMKDSKEYAVNPSINKEIAQLEEKNQYNMFATRISVVGSSRQIVDSLSASFNILSAQNSFKSRLSNFKPTQFRFVPKENIFKVFNRNAFGSLLNIRELTSLIQLSQFQDLSKIRNNEKNLNTKSAKATESINAKKTRVNKLKPIKPTETEPINKQERVKVKKFPRLIEDIVESDEVLK